MRTLRRLLLLAVVLLGAALVLPSSIGGATDYVRSYGNSMEPTFHAGDLAVVRKANSYHVGDVVAYRSPQLDRIVLHRIVDRDGHAFVFRGDNNDFHDAEHLDAGHVLGRLVLRVPRGGTAFVWLTNPLHAVPIAIGASTPPAVIIRKRRRHPKNLKSTRGLTMNPSSAITLRRATPWLAAAGATLLALGVLGLSRPLTHLLNEDVAFTQRGAFTYSASASPPLYPTGITTGDPVFTRLTDRVTVGFAHRVDSNAAKTLDGTVAVDAILTGQGGWERTVPLLDRRRLDGGQTAVEVVLELPALRALAAEAATITGTSAGELRIAVTPTIDIAGTIAGKKVDDRFEPALTFTLDDIALHLATPTDPNPDGLTQTQTATVAVPTTRPTVLSLPLLGSDPTVANARTVGLAGGGALLLLAVALAIATRSKGDDEPARIAARYSKLLLPIRGASNEQQRAVVEVTTIADLIRVAEHHEQLVLHHAVDGHHTYLVEAHGTTYRYVPTTPEHSDLAEDTTARQRGNRHVGAHTKQRRRSAAERPGI